MRCNLILIQEMYFIKTLSNNVVEMAVRAISTTLLLSVFMFKNSKIAKIFQLCGKVLNV